MKKRSSLGAVIGVAFCAALAARGAAGAAEPTPIWTDQGTGWTAAARAAFYTQDQGSRIMPLAWLKALQRADGQPFLADGLSRYGYLANPNGDDGLPVGFHTADWRDERYVGMTCAACHTRQISVDGANYRIDGGPAIVDFQSFLADLNAAAARALESDSAFDAFATAALGAAAQPADRAVLRERLRTWRLRYNALISGSLPNSPWGYGRLDAVSMIFNRLTGLDLGRPQDSRLILENIHAADAPVRYPFLWNASRQNRTQWPGFAPNGSDNLALSRNLGEVFGVFGVFEPEPVSLLNIRGVNYLALNSGNFDGLAKLEDLIKQIAPPKWPWHDGPYAVDAALAKKGEAIFAQQGGCAACHGIKELSFPQPGVWETPVEFVGTDAKEYAVLTRQARPGVLKDATIPVLQDQPLGDPAFAADVLKVSVIGSILQHTIISTAQNPEKQLELLLQFKLPASLDDLNRAFLTLDEIRNLTGRLAGAKPAYESRVLEGIWAAAPYLHNGSVPTLADLLKPARERTAAFKVGPAYDPRAGGLAVDQPAGSSTLTTTLDCDAPLSGNSRCGHEYGVGLPDEDKKALLEYLKTL
jgi:mono/diheme cytochrome c family protein